MKFSVVASFTGVLPEHDSSYYPCDVTLTDAIRACETAGIGESEPSEVGDSEYSYLADESEKPNWFEHLQDYQASGIVDRETLTRLIDDLGAFAEDCETMGTLGGPLAPWGGIVADIPFRIESQVLIECIRVTPIPCGTDGEPLKGDERTWDRVRAAMLAVYGV